ncbi:MAG: type VI secretion system tube protein Hcp [Alphaproteobacteria bacterium]|nr:type VI secretion system tube protein Hcp [Alphaproteobacteria bacterium]
MAVDMFLEIKECPGESTKKGHEGQIDITSFSFGAVQSGSFARGGAGGGAGKAEFQDISVVKEVDKSSPKLFQACAAGTHFGKATIYVRKAGDKPLEYYKVELSDLIVSSVQNSGSAGGDAVMESITFNTAKINFTYVEQDAKGGAGKTVTAGYDVRAGEKV